MPAATVYDAAVQAWAAGGLDWEGDDIRALLATDDYQPSQSTDRVRADLGKAEAAKAGSYQPGGQQMTGRRIEHAEDGLVRLAGGELRWESFTGEFRYVVVYANRGGRNQDLLVAYSDMGGQVARNATVRVEYPLGVCEFVVQTG